MAKGGMSWAYAAGGIRNPIVSPKLVLVMLLSLLFVHTVASALPPCTEAMIRSVYTDCQGSGMKRRIYFFDASCDESSQQSVLLPRPELLPCQCQPGQGISPDTLKCDLCQKGSYGPGGRVLDSVDWGKWTRCPSGLFLKTDNFQMATFCESNFSVVTNIYDSSPCQPWRPGPVERVVKPSLAPIGSPTCTKQDQVYRGAHDYLLSGDQPEGVAILSLLHTVVEVVRLPARIEFTYFVDATPCFDTTGGGLAKHCDGLSFYIDNDETMTAVSQQLTWQTGHYDINNLGYHSLRWQFRVSNANSKGPTNQAAIRSIILVGVEGNTSCAACPPGTYSPASNVSLCSQCPEFQYQNMTGQSRCSQCPSLTYSLKGSAQCYTMKKCNENDLVRHLSNISTCKPDAAGTVYTRLETVDWLKHYGYTQPFCDKSGLAPGSDHAKQVVCQCQPGQQFLVAPSAPPSCSNCLPSRYSVDGVTCYHCPAGTVTYGERTITTWTALPEGFVTQCSGECDDSGWVPSGNSLRTGYSTGSYDSVLESDTITITHPTKGYVSFHCSVDCALVGSRNPSRTLLAPGHDTVSFSDHCHLVFQIQSIHGLGEAIECAPPGKRDGTIMKHRYNLTAGQYRFVWYYHQVDVHYYQSIGMEGRLYSLAAGGLNSSLGGASSCSQCAAGYHANSEQTDCLPCPVGTQSSAGSTECTPCSKGRYATNGTAAECQVCPAGYHTLSTSSCVPCPAGTFSHHGNETCHPCPTGFFSDKAGSAVCLACGSGTTNSHDFTTCDNKQCKPVLNHTVADGSTTMYQYNFTGLDLANMTIATTGTESMANGRRFYFHLCSSPANRTGCFSSNEESLGMKVCMEQCNPGNLANCTSSTSYGKTIGWQLQTPGNVSVYVSYGDRCGSSGSRRSVRIHMMCNLTAQPSTGSPRLLQISADECHAELVWHSKYACPICTETCYRTTQGACDADGTHTSQRQMIQPCYGDGVPGQYTHNIKCITIYAIIGGAVAFCFFVFVIFYLIWSQHMRTQASRVIHSQRMQEKLTMMSAGGVDDDLVDSEYEKDVAEDRDSESGMENDDEMVT